MTLPASATTAKGGSSAVPPQARCRCLAYATLPRAAPHAALARCRWRRLPRAPPAILWRKHREDGLKHRPRAGCRHDDTRRIRAPGWPPREAACRPSDLPAQSTHGTCRGAITVTWKFGESWRARSLQPPFAAEPGPRGPHADHRSRRRLAPAGARGSR